MVLSNRCPGGHVRKAGEKLPFRGLERCLRHPSSGEERCCDETPEEGDRTLALWLAGRGRPGVLGALALLALCSGCLSPNLYGTPRTTPRGKIVQIAGVEGVAYKDSDIEKGKKWSGFPYVPGYQLRYGLKDDLDVGFQFSGASSLGANLKINPVRTRRFDLAFEPGVQVAALPAPLLATFFQVPALLGFNFGESVSLMLSPGVLASITRTSDDILWWRNGFWLRAGGGLNFRVTHGFAIQPEVTVLRLLGSSGPVILMPGVGFSYGGLPSF